MTRPGSRLVVGRRTAVGDTRLRLVPVWSQRRTWRRPALLVRLAQVLAGVAVLLATPDLRPLEIPLMVIGLLMALLSPGRTGPAVALLAGALGWVFGYGDTGSPPLGRLIAFTVALYLLHEATTLAGITPLTATLRPELLRHWLRRTATSLAVAAVLSGLLYALRHGVRYTNGYPLEVLGVAGVVLVLGVAAWLFSRSPR